MRGRVASPRPERFAAVPLEAVRDFWNRRPCNIRHSPRPIGTRAYFDEVERRRYFVEPHIPRFAEFPRWAGKRVLEIGCGIGTDTMNFARAGAHVTAVDLSEESIALARQRAQIYGLADRITFYVADAEHLPETVVPEPYDLVYSFGVVHHTPHPEVVMKGIREFYVHEDSVLKAMLYHRRSWKVFWILVMEGKGAFWKLDELVARNSEAQTGCPVTYAYTRGEAARLLQGFEVVDADVEFIFPYRVRDYVEYRYVKSWPLRAMPRRLFRWLERRAGWHLCLTANVDRHWRREHAQ